MQHGTIIIPFSELRDRQNERPEGYFEDVIASGSVVGDSVHLSLAAHRRLVAKYQGPKPAEKWPLWAKAIAALRAECDVGIGDTIYRIIGPANSQKFKSWHLATFGKSCGCARRRNEWNSVYQYK